MRDTWFRRRGVLAQVVWALALLPPGSLASQERAQDEIIGSPTGRRLMWAIDAVRPGAALEDLADIFVSAFFERIPVQRVQDALREVSQQTGGLTLGNVRRSGPTEIEAAATAVRDGKWWRIVLNVEEGAPFRLTRLSYDEAPELGAPILTEWSQVDSMLAVFPGTVSFAAFRVDGDRLDPLFTHHGDTPLAIASGFKLWVLGALAELIGAGEAAWDEPWAIRNEWKSLPSGRMRLLQEGETRTLADYATQMIANSDNTATDHLIQRIGRDRLARYAARHGSPAGRNLPFLTTYELFKLKINAGPQLLDAYLRGSPEERRQLLEGPIAQLPLPAAEDEPVQPTAITEVEWFASASSLANLMVHLAEIGTREGQGPVREALTQNAGFNWDRATWPKIAYKGGSEAGVVSLTWLMERQDGRIYAMSFSVNDAHAVLDRTQIIVTAAAAGHLLEDDRLP